MLVAASAQKQAMALKVKKQLIMRCDRSQPRKYRHLGISKDPGRRHKTLSIVWQGGSRESCLYVKGKSSLCRLETLERRGWPSGRHSPRWGNRWSGAFRFPVPLQGACGTAALEVGMAT